MRHRLFASPCDTLRLCRELVSGRMSETWTTSTGHMASDAPWLDHHFESARVEYEEAIRFVGIKPGWMVLDAGCGSGGYVPLLCEQVGATGRVAALDLAPENVARVEELTREGRYAARVDPRVGSVLDLPFADATFDCIWCAKDRLLDDPDFCFREAFVVTLGQVPT
jgi:arsenite methyltransferase